MTQTTKGKELWDAVVVGAGPSGTLVAEQLLAQGHRVALLDAGPKVVANNATLAPDEQAWRFTVANGHCDWLRVRAVGGASLAWGGWCNRFPQQVFVDGEWPYSANTLAPYYRAVEQHIGVATLPQNKTVRRALRQLGLHSQPKRYANTQGRPWTALDSVASRCAQSATTALKLFSSNAKADALVTIGPEGERSVLRARVFVLAASAIETARILLASDLAARQPQIGRNLLHHPVVGYALVSPPQANVRDNKSSDSDSDNAAAFVPRFVNLGKRRLRGYRGGFSIEIAATMRLVEMGAELRARLDPGAQLSDDTRITMIHGMGETSPHPDRFVSLADEERDSLGRSVPCLHLAWSDGDRALVNDMKAACVEIASSLAPPQASLVQYLDPFTAPMLFHEAGTCAMGKHDDAPCDSWGRLRALRNVWIADGAALPSAGDRHPTLTILAHAMRAAQSVVRQLGAARSSVHVRNAHV